MITFPLIRITNARRMNLVGKFTGERTMSPIKELPKSWFVRPTSFQAKIGLRELEKQSRKDGRRIAIANRYNEELGLPGPRGKPGSHSVYWQYVVIEKNPIGFRQFFNKKLIDCATTSLVNLTELPEYGIQLNLSSTLTLYSKGIYLPCFHQLSNREQTRIIKAIKSYHESK